MDGSIESLASALQAQKAKNAGRRDPQVEAVMREQAEELTRLALRENALRPGDPAPDFTLPDIDGAPVRLSSLLQNGPAIVSFYRGGWCPYCNIELRALMAHRPQFTALGAQLVAISPQNPDQSANTARENGIAFPVLSDTGNHVARQYRLVFSFVPSLRKIYQEWGVDLKDSNGDDSWTLPLPATFIIKPEGTIAAGFVEYDYTQRMEPAEIVEILREI